MVKSGLLNFVVVAQAGVTTNILDTFSRSAPSKTSEIMHDMADESSTMRVIWEAIDISHGSMWILDDYLVTRKLSASWMLSLLTTGHKSNRATISQEYLTSFNCNRDEFFRRFVTSHEIWIYHNIPKT